MKKQITMSLWVICFITLMFAFDRYGHAVTTETTAGEASGIFPNSQYALPVGKLNDIVDSIQLQRKEIENRLSMLKKAKTEQEKNKIQSEIDEISRDIEDQESSFELILTAGQELIDKVPEEKSFDWQKDLLEIVQPIMSELRQLTEDRRKLDNLKKKIKLYQAKTQEVTEVLNHLAKFDKAALEPDTLNEFAKIEKKWRNELQESTHLLEVAQLQLDEMVKSQAAREVSITEHVQHFVIGRGTTLLMVIATFVTVFFLLQLSWKAIVWIGFRKSIRWSFYQRLVSLVYHSLTVMLAIAASFYVLSVRDDQILLAIAVLILISIIWVLKNSIPRYIDELKLLMNTGAVREGECINYNGIPMKIDHLNVYTKLTNPALPDLKLRLPVSELLHYVSRPYTENEPWFPCQEGDYVLLSDGRYGRVKCITLEHVQLSLSDGSMPQTYTISDFMCASPKNLSQGFLITSVIGIDYKYQSECTTSIPKILEESIHQGLLREAYGHALKSLSVYFEQANTSSLDFKIVVTFEGYAAGDYFSIKRDLQRFAVDVCTRQQWSIPFNQLVVHQGEHTIKS